MKLIDRILAFFFADTVSVNCPKCKRVVETHPDAVEVIKKHGCSKCQTKRRGKVNRKAGTED